MRSFLMAVGYFASPLGGAPGAAVVHPGGLLFELITAGAVYDPGGSDLCGPGWIFAHREGQRTIWRSPPDRHYECLTINVRADRAQPAVDWPRQFYWDPRDGALGFARDMLHDFHHRGVDPALQGDLIWSQLRYRLERFKRRELPRALPPRIASVMAHIDQHYARDLAIDELAQVAGLSPSHLHARFKEQLGTTPHRYQLEQRMREARHRLVGTREPVSAIAAAVGYANTESFCRAFRRLHQSTALAYRRRFTRTAPD